MQVKDLIERLRTLPENSTIGMIDVHNLKLLVDVSICKIEDTIYDSSDDRIQIEGIEKARYSNHSKVCDFYIA